MAANSKIEWTEATWNPVTGCTRVSSGCDHCYAVPMTRRLEGAARGAVGNGSLRAHGAKYVGLTVKNKAGDWHFNGVVRCHEDALALPLGWKKPRTIFVNSMSDLFHEKVPFEFIDKVFAVMNATTFTLPISDDSTRWHTYQVLTKRPERMAEYILSRSPKNFGQGEHPLFQVRKIFRGQGSEIMNASACLQWPPSNVWLGTSIEDQTTADERIPELMKCPAAVRFLSCEPLLGAIDLRDYLVRTGLDPYGVPEVQSHPIRWVICGGESGPKARPMHPDWARSIRDHCVAADVAFFFKQWGEWAGDQSAAQRVAMLEIGENGSTEGKTVTHVGDDRESMFRLGKHIAGRVLDGRTWDEYPARKTAEVRG